MASWHRGIVSQVIAVNFGKAWLSGKKAVGQKPAFFHFMLFFFLRLIFSLELAGTLRCRRLSPRRKICNTPLWKRNHQNLLNLLNYSNTYSNHFLRFSACCIFMFTTPNHHPLPIHDPCTTIVTIITISALLSRSLFISFLWKHTNHVFDSFESGFFMFQKYFFSEVHRGTFDKDSVSQFLTSLSRGGTPSLWRTRHGCTNVTESFHKTTRQAWLKKYKKNTRRHDECLNSGDAVFHLDMIF